MSAALVDRAVTALRSQPRGQAFVELNELHVMSPEVIRSFLEALMTEGERLGLVVEYSNVDPLTGPAGIRFRWYPMA